MNAERAQYVVATHLLLFRGSTTLLMRRANTGWSDGMWSVIAGHVEHGETARSGTIREAHEEAGITCRIEDLRLVHVMHRKTSEKELLDFFFTTDSWHGEPTIGEPEKCDGCQWFAMDDLPEHTVPYIRSALAHAQRHEPYSEFGWPT